MTNLPYFLIFLSVGATFGFYLGHFIGSKELPSHDDDVTPQHNTESRER